MSTYSVGVPHSYPLTAAPISRRPSADSLPLSRQPSIEALSLACHSSLEDIDDIIKRGVSPVDISAKFVYKSPSHIIFERSCFPFKACTTPPRPPVPSIAVQAPTPQRIVSAPATAPSYAPVPVNVGSAPQKKLPAPLPYPLVTQSQSQPQIVRPPSPATTTHSTISATPSSSSTLVPSAPTPRELAERSERVQTLNDAVKRSRAYSALMDRHCEMLTASLETAAQLQAAKEENRRLREKLARYKEVNRTLVHWGLTLRDENEALRDQGGHSPGLSLFDPARDMLSSSDEEEWESGDEVGLG